MSQIIDGLYQLMEESLPFRPSDFYRTRMEDRLMDVMGKEFMEEYKRLCFIEDFQSRKDLFRHSLALGVSLAGLGD